MVALNAMLESVVCCARQRRRRLRRRQGRHREPEVNSPVCRLRKSGVDFVAFVVFGEANERNLIKRARARTQREADGGTALMEYPTRVECTRCGQVRPEVALAAAALLDGSRAQVRRCNRESERFLFRSRPFS